MKTALKLTLLTAALALPLSSAAGNCGKDEGYIVIRSLTPFLELEMEGDQLYVNGKPYSITENTLCQ